MLLTQSWILAVASHIYPFLIWGLVQFCLSQTLSGSTLVSLWSLPSLVNDDWAVLSLLVVGSSWLTFVQTLSCLAEFLQLGVAIVETGRLVYKMFMQVRTKVGGAKIDPYVPKDKDVDLCWRHLKWMWKISGWFFPLLVWHQLICVTASPLSASPSSPSSCLTPRLSRDHSGLMGHLSVCAAISRDPSGPSEPRRVHPIRERVFRRNTHVVNIQRHQSFISTIKERLA